MPGVVERSVVARLRAEVGDYVANMERAKKATEDLHSTMVGGSKKSQEALSLLSNRLVGAGAVLTAFGALAVKKFADFDQAMSGVQSATQESAEGMGLLRDAALEAGKTTVFNATESADAIEALAKAGVSTGDVLGGALKGSLDLAAAGELGVADAAEIAATAMTQFHKSGKDVGHIADLLAAGAGKAQGEVGDLSMALKQSGLVASQTGLSIEETTAGLSAFASAGLLGSDAGTSFKTMLQRLTPQSDVAKQAMDDLGISAYDSRGNFIGLAEFAGNLQNALRDLTPEQRNATEATIFGSDAVRAASVLYDEGEAGIRRWISAVDDQGFAAETAATKLDNLKGDWEALTGAAETALIGMGEGADGQLRLLVQNATDVVNAFADLPDGVQQGTLAIIGGGGLVALGTGGLLKLIIGVGNAKKAFGDLGVSARTAGTAAGVVGAAFAAATVALSIWADSNALAEQRVQSLRDSLDDLSNSATANTREIIANDLVARHGWWVFQKDSAANSATALGLSITDLTDAILGNADAIAKVNAATDSSKSGYGDMNAHAQALGLTLSDLAAAQKTVSGEVGALTSKYAEAQTQESAVESAVKTGAETHSRAAAAVADSRSAVEKYAATLDDGSATLYNFADALKEVVDAQMQASGVVLSERDAQRQLEDAIDSAAEALRDSAGVTDEMIDKNGNLTKAGQDLVEQYRESGSALDITTEKGRATQAALDDIAQSGWKLIDAMRENGASQTDLQTKMTDTRQAFLDTADAAGMSADEANRLADELGLIPSQVSVSVAVDDAQVRALLATLARIPARISTGPGGSGGITLRSPGDLQTWIEENQR